MQERRIESDAARTIFMQPNQIPASLPVGDFVAIMKRVGPACNCHEHVVVARRSPNDVDRKHQVGSESPIEESLSLDQPVVGDQGTRVGSLFHESSFERWERTSSAKIKVLEVQGRNVAEKKGKRAGARSRGKTISWRRQAPWRPCSARSAVRDGCSPLRPPRCRFRRQKSDERLRDTGCSLRPASLRTVPIRP